MRQARSLFPTDDAVGLITDLYQLTMSAGYFSQGHTPEATFEAFVRVLPENRPYLVAAGLEQAVHYLLNLRFTGEQIDWLRGQAVFAEVQAGFWEYLRGFRFAGGVWAMPEGTVIFAGEPVVRVCGSLLESQLVETYLLTALNIQTLVATKASRICRSADGRPVVDFGARRAHGPQAGLLAARASYIGGCVGTSNVYASKVLGIPAVGTQAHSWVMSFDREADAFEAYARVFPEHTICLIDTYDTVAGARRAARLGKVLKGVRLDSGDLVRLSRQVRAVLDRAGLAEVKIVASSDLNEYTIADLLANGAQIDLFGVGTDLVTSKDAPALSIVYKLVEVADESGRLRPVVKLSAGKQTLGGAKQTFRRSDGDVVALANEALEGEPLMVPVMEEGRLVYDLPSLDAIRDRAAGQVEGLPGHLRELRGKAAWPVTVSDALEALQGEASR